MIVLSVFIRIKKIAATTNRLWTSRTGFVVWINWAAI